jgi:hypothetical protein
MCATGVSYIAYEGGLSSPCRNLKLLALHSDRRCLPILMEGLTPRFRQSCFRARGPGQRASACFSPTGWEWQGPIDLGKRWHPVGKCPHGSGRYIVRPNPGHSSSLNGCHRIPRQWGEIEMAVQKATTHNVFLTKAPPFAKHLMVLR